MILLHFSTYRLDDENAGFSSDQLYYSCREPFVCRSHCMTWSQWIFTWITHFIRFLTVFRLSLLWGKVYAKQKTFQNSAANKVIDTTKTNSHTWETCWRNATIYFLNRFYFITSIQIFIWEDIDSPGDTCCWKCQLDHAIQLPSKDFDGPAK